MSLQLRIIHYSWEQIQLHLPWPLGSSWIIAVYASLKYVKIEQLYVPSVYVVWVRLGSLHEVHS